jgi:PEP-CTERM motif-containing protein
MIRKTIHRTARLLCAVGVLSVSATSLLADDLSIRFESDAATYAPGDSISVDILATTSSLLVGFGFDLVFPGEVDYVGFESGGAFVGVGATPDGDGIAGLSFSGGVDGVDFPLGTATFDAVSEGTVLIDLATSLDDLTEGFARFGSGFFDASVTPLELTIEAVGSNDVPPPAGGGGGGGGPTVPEPATAMLLAIGAMAALRTRR